MAITPVFCCGFECGVGGSVGQHWSLGGQNTATFSTTTVRNGLRSLRATGTSQTSWGIATLPAVALRVGRVYVRFAVLPNIDAGVFTLGIAPQGLYFKASDSKIYCSDGTSFGASGVSVVINQWYCLDLRVDHTNNPHLIDGQVDGTALGQVSVSAPADTITTVVCGISACTADIFFDDCIISNTNADYPIGPGKVLAFVPDADGAHTFTSTHAILGTTGAPTTGSNITSATTNAFGFVNARPLGGGSTDSTRLINQATAASTEYAEVDFEATTEANAPRAVEVLGAYQHAAAQACNSQFKLNDNGTENVTFDDTGHTNTADNYFTKQYATMVGGGAWTLARFNALKMRFGYSSDATPDVYCRGLMIEAEFVVSTATPLTLTAADNLNA